MDNNSLKLKNFRVFDGKGTEFEIAPITILTGCNSSGKSSTIKALMLLNNYFERIKSDYLNGKPFLLKNNDLLFNKGKHNLGTYGKALSTYSKNKTMSFSWKKYSPIFFDVIDVELFFVENETNILNNAVITSIKIKFENKEIIELNFGEKFSFQINYILLKERFFHFAYRLNYYDRLVDALGVNDDDIPRQFKDEESMYNPEYKIDKQYIDSIIYAQESLYKRDNGDKLISKCKNLSIENESLFYLPILDWLKDADKKDVNSVIWAKIEEAKETIIDGKPAYEIDEKTQSAVNKILNEFIESKFKTFKDFYLSQEDALLKKISKEKNSYPFVKAFEISFLNEMYESLNLVSTTFSPRFSFIGWNTNSELEYKDDPYTKFMILSKFCCIDKNFIEKRVAEEYHQVNGYFEFVNPLEANAALQYLISLVQDVIVNPPSFIENIDFVDAVRANIQRIYSFNSQGTDFNDLLLAYLGTDQKDRQENKINKPPKSYKLGSFMKKWLQIFEIADDIIFENTNEGLGVLIYLVKGKNKELLADQGYGITQLLAILLNIEINIIKSEFTYSHPLIDSWNNKETRFKESTIAVEEPETNLHPKFQSKLAEMFMDAYKTYNIHFILETHSEYLIRKLQTLINKKDLKPADVSLHYIYEHDPKKRQKGKPQVVNIKISEDGRLSEPFGTGFLDEADNLAFELFLLTQSN